MIFLSAGANSLSLLHLFAFYDPYNSLVENLIGAPIPSCKQAIGMTKDSCTLVACKRLQIQSLATADNTGTDWLETLGEPLTVDNIKTQ